MQHIPGDPRNKEQQRDAERKTDEVIDSLIG